MYVYILITNSTSPPQHYIGITKNLRKRLITHNQGKCKYTRKHNTWKFKNAFWFQNPAKALSFEKYLKSGSGRAFAKKHF